jgi:hypothetical protein
MMLRILICAMVFAVVGVCQAQEPNVVSGADARRAIEEVLRYAQVSGSLAYWGSCDGDPSQPMPDFPNVRRLPKDWKGSAIETLRAMFADDSEMQVTQDANGRVRMAEKNVPRDLLDDVRLSHVAFKDYDGRDGVWVSTRARRIIMRAPEIRSFMQAHKIGWPELAEAIHDVYGSRSPKLPHVSGDLYNVTVAEALDYATENFPGLWVYENCPSEPGSRVVFFEIYWLSMHGEPIH